DPGRARSVAARLPRRRRAVRPRAAVLRRDCGHPQRQGRHGAFAHPPWPGTAARGPRAPCPWPAPDRARAGSLVVNLALQHLSDEAVAAFADGMLATPAHNRATRHVAQCAECAAAVAEQRAAVSALRAAPAPALPAGLLDRLRAVPTTTPLRSQPIALAPD